MAAIIAIGPERNQPSWKWVGADMIAELGQSFHVVNFSGNLPSADVSLFIKHPPSDRQLDLIRRNGTKLIYVPIDFFRSLRHIVEHSRCLAQCDLILLHSQSLAPYLERMAPVRFVNHYCKFSLPSPAAYKEAGYVLWVGALENLPYLFQFLIANPIGLEVRILSNVDDGQSRRRAKQVAKAIGVDFRISGIDQINEHRIHRWDIDLQSKMLGEAKAAIDIKGHSFNQQHKPPAKAQKYICAGLPLALNPCGVRQYCEKLGLNVPLPTDRYWLTKDYYEEIHSVAQRLRPLLTLKHVCLEFRSFIDEVLSMPAANSCINPKGFEHEGICTEAHPPLG